MDKKILAVYITGGVIIVGIITFTIFIVLSVLGVNNAPINISTTSLTYDMADDLLKNYYKIDEKGALEYIEKKEPREAYIDLLNEKTNMILASEIDNDTIKWLNTNGLEIKTTVIAKDGLIFLNNINNPIESLTSEQIRYIYSGKSTNWIEVGGNSEEIIAYRAKENSDEDYMIKKFMKSRALIKQRYEPKDSSIDGLIKALSEYLDTSKKAITYTTFHNIKDRSEDEIRKLRINEVSPTNETIKSGEYEGTMNIYAIIRANEPENSQTRKFVEYITSKNGQAVIEQCGYVNLGK